MFLFGCFFFFFSTRNYNIYTCLRNENVCLSQKKTPKTTEQQTKPSPGLLVTNAMVFSGLGTFSAACFPSSNLLWWKAAPLLCGKAGLGHDGVSFCWVLRHFCPRTVGPSPLLGLAVMLGRVGNVWFQAPGAPWLWEALCCSVPLHPLLPSP